MTTEQQLIQEVAALRHTVDALNQKVTLLVQSSGTRLTREQLRQRRGCHRNTLSRLIERGIVPQSDATGKFLLAEVEEFEALERVQRKVA